MAESQEEHLERLVRELIAELLAELRPGRARGGEVDLDSSLDRDLGLDSLSRVELLGRIRRRLGREVPEVALLGAETPRQLLALLGGAPAAAATPGAGSTPSLGRLGEVTEKPMQARTVIDILDWYAERHAESTWLHLIGDDGGVQQCSYGQVRARALGVAHGLRAAGVGPGEAVSIMLPTCLDFFDAFFGVLLAGAVPVPMYPPVRPSQTEEHLRRQAVILRAARVPLMITVAEALPLGHFLQSQVPGLRRLTTASRLAEQGTPGPLPRLAAEQTAFLQFTSGSTGNPKGVVLSHANLVANVQATEGAVAARPGDVFVSWLPLYHDLGLIGAVLGTLQGGIPLVLMSPLRFLLDPARWMEALTVHGGTLSAAPNFAYELCLKRIPEDEVGRFDLSRWRMTMNGAEPINAETLRRFGRAFAPAGFRLEAMQPVYGLAECSVGLTAPVFGREPLIDRIQRLPFHSEGRAVPASPADPEPLEIVCCGPALPKHAVRVVDDAGRPCPERQEGRIQFRGPSATSGYFENPVATAALIGPDGWLETGDLGYLVADELYVTGRTKDVIIRAGRNLYPYELEEAVGALEGVRRGCVAVFPARDAAAGTEKLVVLAETRMTGPEALRRLEEDVQRTCDAVLGEPADHVLLAPPHTVLKTSSGKIRRAACREAYEEGRLLGGGDALWLQLARMGGQTLLHGLRRGLVRGLELAWAAWFWGVFGLGLGVAWALVMLLPGLRLRALAAAACARVVLLLVGVRLTVRGRENLVAGGPTVFVSNHTSYADNLVLPAVLPAGTRFTPKEELGRNPFLGPFLGRLGALFVRRFEAARGGQDEVGMRQALQAGASLVVFPEGTCVRVAGLLPFRLGAFQAAAETGTPVVPVALRGVRELLRPDQWFPRRRPLEVRIGPALAPAGGGWEGALDLKDRARAWILAECGEPDLGHEDPRRFWPE